MLITQFRNKGLKQLYVTGSKRGVPTAMADKLTKLLFTMEAAASLDQLARFPGWRLHPLKGDLEGFWSLTVTGNWRLVFRYDEATNSATELDLTDYH